MKNKKARLRVGRKMNLKNDEFVECYYLLETKKWAICKCDDEYPQSEINTPYIDCEEATGFCCKKSEINEYFKETKKEIILEKKLKIKNLKKEINEVKKLKVKYLYTLIEKVKM